MPSVSANSLVQVGTPDQLANRIGNTLRTIAGVGTAQTGAASITPNSNCVLGTTAGGATAFVASTAWQVGDSFTFFNTSATTALVYPQSGGAINGGSTNASISVAQNTGVELLKTSSTAWRAIASNASSGSSFTSITADDITGSDSSLGIAGLASTQGGAIALVGGTSSTSANAGGAVTTTGGVPGATGVGGAVTLAGGAGGATSGAGGAASLTGGAGTGGNSAGGAATVTSGAGHGTSAGGTASLVAGVSGGGATGNGGAVAITAGASGATDGNGGSIILTAGALAGTGANGVIIERSVKMVKQGTQTAKTVSATLTAAEILAGIITVNQGGGSASALQLPLATAMDTALPDSAAGDAFDFSVINISTTAAESASLTTNTGWTLVGDLDFAANSAATTKSAGRLRARKTGTGTWTLYRLA
jgi:hypothetical protein